MSNKMKKALYIVFSLVLSGLLLIMTITGCSDTDDTTAVITEENGSSFVIVEQELLKGYYYKIAYHKDTKVMYVLGQYNDFTVMLDAAGKPLLWEGEQCLI